MPLDLAPYPAPPLASSAAALPGPPILACRAWGARYGGGRGPLLDLTQAVPAEPPPPELLERLCAAARDPKLATYGPLEGEPDLREAFAEETRRIHGGDAQADDVRITGGANLAFTLAMSAIAEPGAEVVVPAPWFFNHPMALALRGVRAVPLRTGRETGYVPDPARAEALLTPRTRAIVLVTPNNPTGAVIPPATIHAFAALCRRRGLWLVLDETYRDFLPDGEVPHRLFDRPDWRDFAVQIVSFSKAHGIPGHRLGAVVAGPAFREAFLKAVDNIQICPPRPPQRALAWAIPHLRPWRAGVRDRIAARAARFLAEVRGAGWEVDSAGAYFAWVRPPKGAGCAAVAERLAAEFGVVALPCSAFGPGEGRHLRLAFAALDDARVPEVGERLAAFAAAAA